MPAFPLRRLLLWQCLIRFLLFVKVVSQEIKDVVSELTKITLRVGALETKLDSFMESCTSQLADLKSAVSNRTTEQNLPALGDMYTKFVSEQRLREYKAKFAMVYGFPETHPTESQGPKDFEEIVQLGGEMGIGIDDFVGTQRFGRRTQQLPEGEETQRGNPLRPRMMRVEFASVQSKWTFITKYKSKAMDTPRLNGSYARPDRTKMERDSDLALRKELRTKREANPQEQFMIKRGEVVKVTPKNTLRGQ